LADSNATGPEVVLEYCGGQNQSLVIDSFHGTVCTPRGVCLAARGRFTPPASPTKGGTNTLMLWAKPQLNGSVAVLVINNDNAPEARLNVSFTLVVVNFTASVADVFDIWTQATAVSAVGLVATGFIGHHDEPLRIP
jgi:hypothetical protein